MPAETRSRGAPPPSRVYHSTPALRQVQFPSRRRAVKPYGREARERDTASLKQQTLTQLDFVSSFEEDEDVVLSDSDGELDMGSKGDKENRPPRAEEDPAEVDEEEADTPARTKRKRKAGSEKPADQKNRQGKRRRTLGDESGAANEARESEAASRRRTIGDAPVSSYHTQTLTQFLGRDHELIQDSEDEDDGFNDWLGDPGSPSPRRNDDQAELLPSKNSKAPGPLSARPGSRQESVVPQTPARRNVQFEIPSSSQLSTPQSSMMAWYGPVGVQPSPSVRRTARRPTDGVAAGAEPEPLAETPSKKRVLVIRDSFATESWGSPSKSTPPRSQAVRALGQNTSTKVGEEPRANHDNELSASMGAATPSPRKNASPNKAETSGPFEIPDSDDDDGDFQDEEDEEDDAEFAPVGEETQLVMEELAPSTGYRAAPLTGLRAAPSSTAPASSIRYQSSSTAPVTVSAPTSLLVPSSPPHRSQLPDKLPPTKLRRRPIHYPRPPSSSSAQTQPFESQRVPAAALQALPQPSARSDILLPVAAAALDAVLGGRELHLALSFRVPVQVVRFWLFEGRRLRYMACSGGAGEREGAALPPAVWHHAVGQLYELNNPVAEEDMREEGWMDGSIARYIYLPPAVVGQLLWNLRHAIFAEDDALDGAGETQEDEAPNQDVRAETPSPSISVSQQVQAQLQSDIDRSTQLHPMSDDLLVPSTPEEDDRAAPGGQQHSSMQPPPAKTPGTPPHEQRSRSSNLLTTTAPNATFIRPSQATTASQTSLPSQPSNPLAASSHTRSQQPHAALDIRLSPPPPIPSSSNLTFQDDGAASPTLVALLHGSSSQLLTRSQMLPESLVRDDARVPPEIWDSDEEDDAAPL